MTKSTSITTKSIVVVASSKSGQKKSQDVNHLMINSSTELVATNDEIERMSSSKLINNGTSSKRHSKALPSLFASCPLVYACLIIACFSINQQVTSAQDSPSPYEYPCFCYNNYYRDCPQECKIQPTWPDYMRSKAATTVTVDHDDDHPDHPPSADIVPDSNSRSTNISPNFNWPNDLNEVAKTNPKSDKVKVVSSTQEIPYVPEDTEKIVRHRKVYVVKKELKKQMAKQVLPSIRLTIPISVDEDTTRGILPPPKPYFKLRKYVTYEDQKHTEMMPVTKTIIKPANIETSRIIGLDIAKQNHDRVLPPLV